MALPTRPNSTWRRGALTIVLSLLASLGLAMPATAATPAHPASVTPEQADASAAESPIDTLTTGRRLANFHAQYEGECLTVRGDIDVGQLALVMHPCDPFNAATNQDWQFDYFGTNLKLLSYATPGRCADPGQSGMVYMAWCQGGNPQLWTPTIGTWFKLMNVELNLCLSTINFSSRVIVETCSQDANQRWKVF
jgi:hypothetical protein